MQQMPNSFWNRRFVHFISLYICQSDTKDLHMPGSVRLSLQLVKSYMSYMECMSHDLVITERLPLIPISHTLLETAGLS